MGRQLTIPWGVEQRVPTILPHRSLSLTVPGIPSATNGCGEHKPAQPVAVPRARVVLSKSQKGISLRKPRNTGLAGEVQEKSKIIFGVSCNEVPSKFYGLWEGSAVSSENTWTVSVGITGGSVDSIVAFMYLMSSENENVCFHKIKLTTGEDKKAKKAKKKQKAGGNEDVFEGKTEVLSSNKDYATCYPGEFKFEASQLGGVLVHLTWRDAKTEEIAEDFLFFLERVDNAHSTKAMETCKAKIAPSPVARLRSKLSCQEDKVKAKSKKNG